MLHRSTLSLCLASARRLIDDVLAIATALAILLAGIARLDVSTRTRAGDGDAEANKEMVRTTPPGEGAMPQSLTPTIAQARAALSDVAIRVDDLFAEDDFVVARTTIIVPIAATSSAPRQRANRS